MRTIKFRAWDKQTKSMIINSTRTITLHGGFDNNNPMFTLMQYTGLKDKNGVEIYEGDIVKIEAHYEGDSYPKWVDTENIEIIFEDGAFNIDSAYIKNNSIEVIGNIYENEDLL